MPSYHELEVDETEMEEFLKSRVWQAILFEIVGRDEVLMSILRNGNNNRKDHPDSQLGNDDTIRGRLSELEFVAQIPQSIIVDIRQAQKIKKNDKED